MHKWIMFVLLIGVGVLGIGALVATVDKHAKENAPEDTGGVASLKIVASNYKFDKAEYTVTKGETLKVSISNAEGIHELEIPELGIKLDRNNPSAQVTFDKAGTFTVKCSLPCGTGHDTMVSKLIVA